jgi:hypothetical protein
MKSLPLFLVLLAPLAATTARADSGWKGTCKDFSERLVVQILPWDDDGKVIVTQFGRKIYEGVDLVSTFDDKAKEVTFEDEKAARMTLSIHREETSAIGMLKMAGRQNVALNCQLAIVDEE